MPASIAPAGAMPTRKAGLRAHGALLQVEYMDDDKFLDPIEARKKAMDYLARREHGRGELLDKLTRFGFDPAVADDAVAQLVDDGLQSDARFAEAFVRSRINQVVFVSVDPARDIRAMEEELLLAEVGPRRGARRRRGDSRRGDTSPWRRAVGRRRSEGRGRAGRRAPRRRSRSSTTRPRPCTACTTPASTSWRSTRCWPSIRPGSTRPCSTTTSSGTMP